MPPSPPIAHSHLFPPPSSSLDSSLSSISSHLDSSLDSHLLPPPLTPLSPPPPPPISQSRQRQRPQLGLWHRLERRRRRHRLERRRRWHWRARVVAAERIRRQPPRGGRIRRLATAGMTAAGLGKGSATTMVVTAATVVVAARLGFNFFYFFVSIFYSPMRAA